MADEMRVRAGVSMLVCDAAGPAIRGEADCDDLIGAALGGRAELVVLPAGRLTDDFFTLRTGVAGGILQKFVNYRLVLAITGDISAKVAASDALRDFVYEANRGRHTWFVATMDDLDPLLARISP